MENSAMPKTATKTAPPTRRLLTREEAAEYMAVSTATLARWASERTGPPFVKLGNGQTGGVRYAVEAIDEFIAERTKAPKVDNQARKPR